jgi:hypothetical protein
MASARAQMFQCPAGSRQVSGGGGIMCQCADGSFASISGCRVQQRQMQQQQRGPQQANPRQIQAQMMRRQQINLQRAQIPLRNRLTGQFEVPRRAAIRTQQGKTISYPRPDYEGILYAFLEGIAVAMDDRYDSMIYPDLESGDPERIENAVNLIEGSAMSQGLIEMTESDGD